MKRQDDDPLLQEAQKTDYGLRSTFFYRKLHGLRFARLEEARTAFVRRLSDLLYTGKGEVTL